MEETRSFGYVCPKCGKAVVARRSKFALSAAAVRMECPKCGESALEVQTDGVRFGCGYPAACAAGYIRRSAALRSCWRAVASLWPARRRSSCAATPERRAR